MSATSGARDADDDRPGEAEAIVQLRAEQQRLLDRLTALESDARKPPGLPPSISRGLPQPGQGPPSASQELDALEDFASNAAPTGPISQTAAALHQQAQPQLALTLSATAPEFLPSVAQAVQPGELGRVHCSAGSLLSLLSAQKHCGFQPGLGSVVLAGGWPNWS